MQKRRASRNSSIAVLSEGCRIVRCADVPYKGDSVIEARNTVPAILKALVGVDVSIADSEYDNLFLVQERCRLFATSQSSRRTIIGSTRLARFAGM